MFDTSLFISLGTFFLKLLALGDIAGSLGILNVGRQYGSKILKYFLPEIQTIGRRERSNI
jgi:hypothetical protein